MINFSELLWRSKRPRSQTARVSNTTSASKDISAELPNVPVDEVQLSPESRIVFFTDPRSPGADRFRFIRIRLRELQALGELRTLLITSPLPQDGKSTVALNLAATLAEGGKRSVLLIEADLHHPSLAKRLGLPRRAGLAECIESRLDPLSAISRVEPLGCYLLQAGEPCGNPAELLQGESVAGIVQRLASHFDWVLIDTPPVVPLTDAVCLLPLVDASLLVVRADTTPMETIDEAVAVLGPKHIVGIVLNGASRLNKVYSQYYRYGYYSKK
jgi:capsular exopolysaccharide synthesis family protein